MDVEMSVYVCCSGNIFSSPFVFYTYREGEEREREREGEGESV